MQNETFLFLYENMRLGGIETNLMSLIETFHSRKHRIIWMRYGKEDGVFAPWKNKIEDCNVEIIKTYISNQCWFKHDLLTFDVDEHIHAVAFEPMDFVRLELLSQEFPENEFELHYIVPHFEMQRYYYEELFFGVSKRIAQKKLSDIYNRWYKNGSLSFFSEAHEREMNKRYGLECLDDKENLFQKPFGVPDFDEENAKKRAEERENRFIIVTCGRFDFPHKGYLFGLVDKFCELKKSFPQLELEIVGYGDADNEKKIRDHVEKMSENIKKSISFLGAISPDDMKNVFRSAHVNISVSGSVAAGCRAGLVSLSARHYSYSCEVYGWISKDNSNFVRDDPGEDVSGYISELVKMSANEYIEKCRMSHDAVEYAFDPDWLFKRKNLEKNYYNDCDILYMRKIYRRVNLILSLNTKIKRIAVKMGLLERCRKIKKKKLSL